MKKPTDEQVEAEIETLRKMKPTVKQLSLFGDDHHKAIDAQIKTLERGFSEDDLYDRYDSNKHSLDSAQDAQQWRDGEERDSEGEGPPSDEWKSLVKK